MARGSLVGDAYVRIHADSSAMAREIKREAGLAGEKAGKTAGANFNRSVLSARKAELRAINQRLIKGVVGGKPEWDKQFKQSGLASVDDFVKAASQSFDRLGKQAQKAGAAASFKAIQEALADMNRWADDARVQEAIARANAQLKEQIKLGEVLARDTEARLRKQRRQQEALGASIVRDMKKAEVAARKAQEALGAAMARDVETTIQFKFDKEAERQAKAASAKLIKTIVGGPDEWDKAFRTSAAPSVDAFVRDMSRQIKSLRAQGFTGGTRAIRDLEKWAKATDVVSAGMKKQAKAVQDNGEEFDNWVKTIRGGSVKAEDAFSKIFSKEKQKQIDDMNRRLARGVIGGRDEWAKQFRQMGGSLDKFVRDTKRQLHDLDVATDGLHFEELQHARIQLDRFGREGRVGMTRLSRALFATGRNFGSFNRLMGKAFGKGSRNDFLNFVGSVVQGMSTIATSIAKIPFKIVAGGLDTVTLAAKGLKTVAVGLFGLFTGKGFSGFAKGLPELADGIKGIATELGVGLMGALKAGLPALIAFAAIIQVAAFVLPPMVGIFLNLAAAVGALAGAIGVGLMGALLPLLPILLAVGGGVGVLFGLITGLLNMTDKQKARLKPFLDAWTDFKNLFKDSGMTDAFIDSLNNLAPVFKVITPLIKGLAGGLNQVISYFAALFGGPKMSKVFADFAKELPVILGTIGQGFVDLVAGILASLKPLMPFAERLAKAFAGMAADFFAWATSAEGQTAITDFMEVAWGLAKNLWDSIVAIGKIIGEVFFSGAQNGGDDILAGITRNLQALADWLGSEEGQASMKKFFEDGKKFAQDLWGAIKEIWAALQTIDWEDARAKASTVIQWIGTAISTIIVVVGAWKTAIENIGDAFKAVGNVFIGIYNAVFGPIIDKLLGGFSAIARTVADLLDALSNVPGFGWAHDAAQKLREAATKADLLGDNLRSIPEFVPVNVSVGLSGPGAKLIQQSMARRRPDVVFAEGGILTSRRYIRPGVVAGEAGREAIVPLDRPLQLVDRSVRELAAFARGLPATRAAAGGTLAGGGIMVADGAIRVTAPNSDPVLVAEALFDRFIASVR